MSSRQIKIYNTLTRKKEIFNPIVKNHIGMYVCGPTVYGNPHLGHARPAITFDVIFRYLKKIGYSVRYVRNITDAGHLENDADEGEGKIDKKARIEQLEPMEIVQKYTVNYHKAIDALNCLPPSIEPRATGHIIEQIEMVKKIIENGFAYVVNGSVYLDVNKYNHEYPYGILSGRNLNDTLEGTRMLDNQLEKKSSVDFAIWKKASPEHIMRWPSPWGDGFPGWHMECSAMSEKYLGKKFDIHGGGMDLIFPHHEAEIAQSNACNNCNPANYWMHNNMVTINGQKMGKSLGNFINLQEFFTGDHKDLTQAYSPMTIRFFILQAHYRGTLDFSNNALMGAEKGLSKLFNGVKLLNDITICDKSTFDVDELNKKCYAAMDDDFNTPILISHLFDAVRIINSAKNGKEQLTKNCIKKLKLVFEMFLTNVLGLVPAEKNVKNDTTKDLMSLILKLRDSAKEKKDFKMADIIRDKLKEIGVIIKDHRNGSSWEKIN